VGVGEIHTVMQLALLMFSHVGLNFRHYVTIDAKLFRPAKFDSLQGDTTSTKMQLGWRY
jgi:GDPmannose 4,6-dehydratase